MKPHERLAFALRPGVFSPREIGETATLLDQNANLSHIFIPDGRSGFESLEVVSAVLGATKRVHCGSGVIRLLEHDPSQLARRIQTMQAFSNNRFFLGAGTGSPGAQPGKSVIALLDRLDELRKGFHGFMQGVLPPEIYVAALKTGMARRAAGKAEGLLLNFCSPRHASDLVEAVTHDTNRTVDFACYLKIFYSSKSDEDAQRLMLQEFLNYDSAPQYHEMFLQDGTADAISSLKQSDEWKAGTVKVPKELMSVSLANSDEKELRRYVESFRNSGVTLPVVYPYFPSDEKSEFKLETIRRVLSSQR